MKKILAPIYCPACESLLALVKDQLFCRNNTCSARTGKLLQHFCKIMKIKGMGPKTLEKLDISSVPELYELTEQNLKDILGDTIGSKLSVELSKSKTKELPLLLAAFSIPLIGNTAAVKIGNVVNNINDITKTNAKEAGLGDKAVSNLCDWLETSWFPELCNVPITQISTLATLKQGDKPVHSLGTVVITGKLDDFKNRTEAAEYLETLGFKVAKSVTKTTNFLIDEAGRSSSSRSKAETLGIKILTIKQLQELSKE